jgi:hypothetical protein
MFQWRVRQGTRGAIGEVAGTIKADGYCQIRIDNQSYYASRLAWLYVTGQWPRGKLDHKNNRRADNRFDNLRQATDNENARNRVVSDRKKSGLPKGVTYFRGLYRATIQQVFLGYFPTVERAAAEYAMAAKKLHGSFARY